MWLFDISYSDVDVFKELDEIGIYHLEECVFLLMI